MALADLRALAAVRVAPVAPAESPRGNTCDGAQPEEIRHFPAPVSRVSRVSPENDNAGGNEAAALLCGIAEAPDVQADRAAIAAEGLNEPFTPSVPPADLVERLAAAMAAPRPWQRIEGDPAPALAYCRGEARRRLDRLDGLARGLLVQAAEAEARRWAAAVVHARGTGR